jgi:hypothetical protein
MKKILLTAVLALALTISANGCKKKEEQPVPKTPAHPPVSQMDSQKNPTANPHAGNPNEMPSNMKNPHSTGPKTEKKIIVPENIKAAWKKIKLVVEDKKTKKTTELIAAIGSEIEIPNTKLKVVVGEFLPEFRIDGGNIMTVSNEPKNPAVRVEILENGKTIFKGWLYSKFPDIHPFEHEQYKLLLKEGIKG